MVVVDCECYQSDTLGFLTQYLDWRWCLYVNLPIAALVAIGAFTMIPKRAGNSGVRLDIPGTILGCGGLVASAKEAGELRRELGEGFAIVTPGVRPAGSAAGDQARVVTPRDAIAAGASHLVVGRPIIEADDPAKAAAAIVSEIEAAQLVDK